MKQFIGTVVSTKMAKTVVVVVKTRWAHPLYKKTVSRSKKYLVHDELGAKEGEVVAFVGTKPISKRKRFITKKIVERQGERDK